MSAPIAIRDATRDDVGLLYSMVQALALRFYASIGATTLDEWRMLRLDDHALQRLGGDSQPVR